ncbi:MAG TPA: hypothetical protein VI168_10065 [Croceibacterium sp.]
MASPVLAQDGPSGEPAVESDANSEVDLAIERAMQTLQAQTEASDALWGMAGAEWSVDLETGIIEFQNDKGWTISAPVQVVGTYDTLDSTFLWGWDHPSVSPGQAESARMVREFGERNGLEVLTTRMVEVSEDDAWVFTALANHLAGGQGGYRGPSGTTLVFMTFGNVTISGR